MPSPGRPRKHYLIRIRIEGDRFTDWMTADRLRGTANGTAFRITADDPVWFNCPVTYNPREMDVKPDESDRSTTAVV